MVDVYRGSGGDDLRERALLSHRLADVAAEIYSNRLPIFHSEPSYFFRADAVHTAGKTTVGRWLLFCLGERVQSFCDRRLLGIHDRPVHN